MTQESTTGTKTTFLFFSSPGNNNGTSVEDGQIPEIIYYIWTLHAAMQVQRTRETSGHWKDWTSVNGCSASGSPGVLYVCVSENAVCENLCTYIHVQLCLQKEKKKSFSGLKFYFVASCLNTDVLSVQLSCLWCRSCTTKTTKMATQLSMRPTRYVCLCWCIFLMCTVVLYKTGVFKYLFSVLYKVSLCLILPVVLSVTYYTVFT